MSGTPTLSDTPKKDTPKKLPVRVATPLVDVGEAEEKAQVLKAMEKPKIVLPPAPKLLIHPSSPVLAPVDSKGLSQLLKYVAEGEQDKAEELLKCNPGLLLQKGVVRDLSKREFKGITGFQYALWALDWHMWKMLLKYMDKEAAAEQFAELEAKGTAHGKHFSLEGLIGALNGYVKNYDAWVKAKAWDKMESYWCGQVGGAQLLLPVHVVNEYCHPSRSFEPTPEFKEEGLVRSMKLYGDQGQWFTAVYNGGKLGEKFGIVRYNRAAAQFWYMDTGDTITRVWAAGFYVKGDAEAIQSLWKMRLLQLESLKSELPLSKTVVFKGK